MEHQVYKQRRLGPGVFSIGRLVADKQTKADLKIETGAIIFDDCKNKKKYITSGGIYVLLMKPC